MRRYTCWDFHGEKKVVGSTSGSECNMDDDLPINNDRHDLNDMLYDFDDDVAQKEHSKFEKLFVAVEKALYGGCTKLTIIFAVIKLFKIKALFGSKQHGNDIDVYLKPLIDDLIKLWEPRVKVYDAYSKNYFTLQAMIFAPSLFRNHSYRKKKEFSDGIIERGELRLPLDGEDTFSRVRDMNIILGKGKDNPVPPKGIWKKKYILWDFMEHLQVRYCLDVMHIEKNVCEELAAKVIPEKCGTYLPPASYTMSKIKKTKFCQCLQGIKVPSSYSDNIKKLVSMKDLKLSGIKSHDCHVLMTQMIPIAIRRILPNHIRLTKLCLFFNMIHSKVIDPEVLDKWQHDVILMLCRLEMYFPPPFFDVMVHLVSNIVREIRMCGPPFLRISGVILPNMRDRWILSFEALGDFLVTSARRLIDDYLLPKGDVQTRWVKVVPIKINVFTWRVRLDKLPTRLNLSLRGVDISSIMCPLCNSSVESASHLFFTCHVTRLIWKKVL
nr:hypothetical protein [Tanacetum cinerariifolium]